MDNVETDISTILSTVDRMADAGDQQALQARAEIQATRHGNTLEDTGRFNKVVRDIAVRLNIGSRE